LAAEAGFELREASGELTRAAVDGAVEAVGQLVDALRTAVDGVGDGAEDGSGGEAVVATAGGVCSAVVMGLLRRSSSWRYGNTDSTGGE